jgi:hypothetical protein
VLRQSRELLPETGINGLEMRAATRYRILQRCFVHPAGASAREAWQCIAYNISAIGIGVTLPVELQEGTELSIQALGLPQACPLQVRIMRTNPIEPLWFTGCELLNRLSDADLAAWSNGPLDWMDELPS